jgi:hypothetical protein
VEGKVGAGNASASPAESAAGGPGKNTRAKSWHLMCGTALWGFAGAIVSAYLSYLSYSHLDNGDYSWPHTLWTVLTYLVWMVLIGGLLTETRCWRERVFFGLVLLTFFLGFVLSAWFGAPIGAVRQLRMASTVLWALAALASLTTSLAPGAASSRAGK